MRTKTKAFVLALCAVLLVVSTVFVTMAFLTSTDSVTNTFTFGKVVITLDEAKVDTSGVKVEGADRVKTNEYHLIPGHTYVKDPIIHVDDESEDCWLFVKLENDLKEIIAATTIEEQMTANGNWICIDEINQIYAYKEVCKAGADVDTFKTFKLIDGADVSKYATKKDSDGKIIDGATIEVTAYAVQADGFDTAKAAWDATSANFSANN